MTKSIISKSPIVKGQYGYIKKRRKTVLLLTVSMFLLSLAVYLTGYFSTGSNQNLLTIVAVLGCLPACKSMVNFIMYLRAKGCSFEVYNRVSATSASLPELYDLFFTSYDKNYQVSHLVLADHLICGITEDVKLDEKAGEKHLETQLAQGGCKHVTVKLYKDLNSYCTAIETLAKRNAENAAGETGNASAGASMIQSGLLSISL